MTSASPRFSAIEPLEARIAPAVIPLTNPLPNIVVGAGTKSATVDLTQMTAPVSTSAYHTFVQFVTNFDVDPSPDVFKGGVITIELFDDATPLTVQNFLKYVTSVNAKGDFDGTIFHRSFDFGGGSGAGRDIIQGGGFNTDFSSVVTGPIVHNEFSDSRPNAAYTIAMAKTTDPNSATSSWFFNKNDNTSILGSDNSGGFTVFGKVSDAESKQVIDGIAALTTQNFGGAFANLPVQNYTSGTPTVDQLIRVVDAKVVPHVPAVVAPLKYSVVRISKAGTTEPSNIISATVSGSKLNLAFTGPTSPTDPAADFADVVLRGTNGTDTVEDIFRVERRANLIVSVNNDGLPFLVIPGDTSTFKINLTDTGGAPAKGGVDLRIGVIKLQSSTDGGGNVVLTVPASPVKTELSFLHNVPVNIGSGLTQVISSTLQIPKTLVAENGSYYQIYAEVQAATINDKYTDDNAAQNGGNHQFLNEFGTFSETHTFNGQNLTFSRTNAVLKYTTSDSKMVSWSMTGAGFGTISPDGKSLQTKGTSGASVLTPTVQAGAALLPFSTIQFDDFLGTANLGKVEATGLISASGGIKALTLGKVTGDSLMLIGPVLPANATKATITLGSVKDLSIESAMPIATLSVKEWLDTAASAADTISAPSLGVLKVAGDFAADVTLTDVIPTTSISVTGFLRDSTIQTVGNIGAITVGGIEHSNVFAGVTARPTALSDFANPATITSFTIAGTTGTNLFVDSQVAAQTIGAIKVRAVNADGAADFGFVADVIKSYSRAASPGQPALSRSNLTVAESVDDLGDYVVKIL